MIYINSTLRIRRLDPKCLQLEEYHKPDPKKPKTKDERRYPEMVQVRLFRRFEKRVVRCIV